MFRPLFSGNGFPESKVGIGFGSGGWYPFDAPNLRGAIGDLNSLHFSQHEGRFGRTDAGGIPKAKIGHCYRKWKKKCFHFEERPFSRFEVAPNFCRGKSDGRFKNSE